MVGRALALTLSVVLVVTACGSSTPPAERFATPRPSTAPATPSPTPAASPTQAPARWSDCGDGFLCATIRVPRDYSGEVPGQVQLSLVRRPADDPEHRIGSLLFNPGGPGASGVEFVRDGWEVFPEEVLERFDLVGFDPRGVNRSSGIRCVDNLDPRAQLDPSPDDDAEVQALIDDAEQFAEDCARRNGDLLPYLSTDAVADDLDRIRAAVGDEQLTYLGVSYGTLIGSLYADRYPDRVRAMILDSPLDPSHDLVTVRSEQAVAFEAALRRFLADCAERPGCVFARGRSNKVAAFDALIASIDARSLPARRTGDRRRVGAGLAAAAVLGALYSKQAWPALEAGLALAELGDGSLLLLIADPFRGRKPNGAYSNLIDAYTAVNCLDYPARTDPAEYTRLGVSLRDEAPHFAQQVAYNDLACAFWSVPPTRVPGPVRGGGAPPILVVGTTGDTATPYAWSEALAGQLESAVHVRNVGEGHGAFGTSDCIGELYASYLVTLEVPDDGASCP